jgi:hypothetical protein
MLVESTRLSCESPVYQMVATGEREAVVELDNGAVLTYSEVRTFVTLDMTMNGGGGEDMTREWPGMDRRGRGGEGRCDGPRWGRGGGCTL